MLFSAAMKTAAFLLALLLPGTLPAPAASLGVAVKDTTGSPLEDAVAWVVPKGAAAQRTRAPSAVEQINKTFVPMVTVIQAGTLVAFPNRDEIRHHVYSFSPAKVFEIKLYAGTPVAPILFDKPGEVVLGCNIHDHMIAYIYVVDTPHFGKAGRDGRVRIEALPAGDYDVHAWHYSQAGAAEPQALKLRGEDASEAEFTLAIRPRAPRAPPK
jgi:plastocyanin